MPVCTLQQSACSFWPKKEWHSLVFARFKPPPLTRLFCLPKIKTGAERWPFCFDRRYSEICIREIKSIPNFWLRAGSEMARRSCQWVNSSVRRLFRINITYLNFCIFFTIFAALSQNLPGTPCIRISSSNQKSIFDHDRLIGLQKLIFRSDHRYSIIYDRFFHFSMIDFLTFFWLA